MKCKICDKSDLVSFINLGNQPNGNHLLTAKESANTFELNYGVCLDCISVQLIKQVPKENLFSNHPYLTGVSQPYVKQLENFVKLIIDSYPELNESPGSLCIDIGCNDGTLLEILSSYNFECIGVDPSETSYKYSREKGFRIIQKFWDKELASSLIKEKIKPNLIVSTASFYHMEDIKSWISGVDLILNETGVVALQFVYLKDILSDTSIDQFYHEHTFLHSIFSINKLLQKTSLYIDNFKFVDVQGGSVILLLKKGDRQLSSKVIDIIELEEKSEISKIECYKDFNSRFQKNRANFLSLLRIIQDSGGTIAGLGASLRGISLLNYFDVTSESIKYLYETNREKIGKFTPKSNIEIIAQPEEDLWPKYMLVLSWTFKDHFLEKHKNYLKRGGNFIFPMPVLSMYGESSNLIKLIEENGL
jgi:hypothetical protein